MKRNSVILLVLIIAVALAATSDHLAVSLQFDRKAILDQFQLWRIITCHLTHWNYEHYFWDMFAFVIAAYALLRLSPGHFWPILLIAPIFISIWILVFNPDVRLYRGFSGVDMALFVFLALSFANCFANKRQWYRMLASILLLLGLTAKIAYESLSGNMLFISDNISGNLLLSAHIAGSLTGLVYFLFRLYAISRLKPVDNKKSHLEANSCICDS
jgi:rhomboid family GlyGly-CTERM serine protease